MQPCFELVVYDPCDPLREWFKREEQRAFDNLRRELELANVAMGWTNVVLPPVPWREPERTLWILDNFNADLDVYLGIAHKATPPAPPPPVLQDQMHDAEWDTWGFQPTFLERRRPRFEIEDDKEKRMFIGHFTF